MTFTRGVGNVRGRPGPRPLPLSDRRCSGYCALSSPWSRCAACRGWCVWPSSMSAPSPPSVSSRPSHAPVIDSSGRVGQGSSSGHNVCTTVRRCPAVDRLDLPSGHSYHPPVVSPAGFCDPAADGQRRADSPHFSMAPMASARVHSLLLPHRSGSRVAVRVFDRDFRKVFNFYAKQKKWWKEQERLRLDPHYETRAMRRRRQHSNRSSALRPAPSSVPP